MDRDQQTTEVREVNTQDNGTSVRRQTVAQTERTDGRIVAHRVVWYIAGVIIALLAIRVLLYLFGANQGAAFVDFIYSITWIFAAPFYGIFPQPAYGESVLDTASILAMIIYALVAWAIAKLFVLNAPRATTEI